MNSIVAASLFDSPWLIVVIVLVGALSNWLMKRRQPEALASPNESESPPSRGQQEPSTRQPDLRDILRQLLGGEPTPAEKPPTIPQTTRDKQMSQVEDDEDPIRPERIGQDKSLKSYEGRPQPLNQLAEHSRRQTVMASVIAPHSGADDRYQDAVQPDAPLNRKAMHPVMAMGAIHRRHSNMDGCAVHLWHDHEIVRQAFIASLIFAPPKGLEA